MKATLVDFMGTDLTVVNAARVSFAKHESEFGFKDRKLLKYLAEHEHWTPFAHLQATFHIEAPIFVRTQCFKHKVGFVENEISRRYVDYTPTFFVPTTWRQRARDKKQGSLSESIDEPKLVDYMYGAFLEEALEVYESMLNAGVAPEQARMVLPQSMNTEWYWTGSAVAFSRFVWQRTREGAQLETKMLAKMVSEQLKEVWPVSWGVLCETE
jgi:thymidylate synthase (FAD)